MSRRLSLLLAISGAVLAALLLAATWRRTSTVGAQVPTESREKSPAAEMELKRVARLVRKLERLEARVERLANDAVQPSDTPTSEAADSDVGSDETDEATAPLSDPEVHERYRVAYDGALSAEARDATTANEFEARLHAAFASDSRRRLERVECRSTLCKLEISHQDPRHRTNLDDLHDGPLKYGSYSYWDEDAQRTMAFIGMPDHNLQVHAGLWE